MKTLANFKGYPVPWRGHPMLHQEIGWYATDDDRVLGVLIRDKVDDDYSWVLLRTPRRHLLRHRHGGVAARSKDRPQGAGMKRWRGPKGAYGLAKSPACRASSWALPTAPARGPADSVACGVGVLS